MTNKSPQKLFFVIILVSLVAFSLNVTSSATAQSSSTKKIYVPLVVNRNSTSFSTNSKFFGIYMQQFWTDQTVSTYMTQADNLAGKKHTVSGWYISLQNVAFTSKQTDIRVNNFYSQLEALWKYGYLSFVNIQSASTVTAYEVTDNCPIPFSAYQVAKGDCDRAIQRMAGLYSQWISKGGGRKAFIAPFPEMNGVYSNGKSWTSYGGDAANFKLAYQRVINIFNQAGVTRDKVWWVFAPNGWNDPVLQPQHAFENYYPGDNLVDMIGFSSYNYGYCHVAYPWQRWENYGTIYAPYIARIHTMAPEKPIIVAQTGTTAEYSYQGENNVSAKNTWLKTNYQYLGNQPQVLGIIYYDFNLAPGECNWSITTGGPFTGYKDATAYQVYHYLSSQDINNMAP